MNLLRNIFYPPITLERFKAVRLAEPRRICFSSTHKSALKRSFTGKAFGFLNLPFTETISEFLPWKLFKNTKGKFGGYYRLVPDEAEFESIKGWISDRSELVFIRSALTTAVAAGEHWKDADHRSEIGELEHAAKYDGSNTARAKLADLVTEIARRLYDGRVHVIASVPPTTAGAVGLPQYLAGALSDRLNLPNVTAAMKWNGQKPSLKELSVDQKWAALEQVGLSIERGAIQGKSVLLVDDMYQSGTTVHFVGGALRAAGANDIHVLAVSKGRRDTDNT